MKVSSVWNSAVVGLATVVLAAALFGWTQNAPAGIQSLPNPRGQGRFGETTDPDFIFADKRVNALNTDRQKSMVSDADKLVKLARQLDAEIASNTTDDLTAEELHKVAEIEKLARSVKAKMAQSFGPGPQFHQPQIPLAGPGRQ
jgi:hypothetical protein